MTHDEDPEHQEKTMLERFYERNQNLWRHYAYIQTGNPKGAEEIADNVAGRLMLTWESVLQQRNISHHAWLLLKDAIRQWLSDNDVASVFVDTAVFNRTTRIGDSRDTEFEALEESLSLYTGIIRLPERQRDVMILRHVICLPYDEIAKTLDITYDSARSNLRHATEKLASIAVQRRLLHTAETEG